MEMWILASETLLMMEKAGYDTVTAKEVLADQLREGRIKLRAQEAWTSVDPTLGKAWGKSPSKSDISVDVEVPVLVFRRSKSWSRNHKNWNWMENKFYVTTKSNPIQRRVMVGASFLRDEIETLIKKPREKPRLVPEKKPRPVWHHWVSELIHFLTDDNGSLTGHSAFSLHDLIDKRLAAKGLPQASRSTTANLASHLIDEWGKSLETGRNRQ